MEKLPHLSLGEKTALARLADRPIMGALLDGGEVDVLVALLGNPRLVEEDLTAWLLVRRPGEDQLVALSESVRWMERTAVRTALLLSPRTPRAIALSLLTSSERPVWERLALTGTPPSTGCLPPARDLSSRRRSRGRRAVVFDRLERRM